MKAEFLVPDLTKREENFFNGEKYLPTMGDTYYLRLELLLQNIKARLNSLQGQDNRGENILLTIFSNVYDFVATSDDDYSLFSSDMVIYDDVFDVCVFISLCMFLYETRRIKGKSLRRFIYDHSLKGYNDKGSTEYFDYEHFGRFFLTSSSDIPEVSSEHILKDEANLRQYKHRRGQDRPVCHDSSEWTAIRRVSEHEWTLYFVLDEAENEIRDTYKRIRVLHSGLNKELRSFWNDRDLGKLEIAYDKFLKKLAKIQYGHFLNLGKFCLDHICKDKTCYGINLYRFEKNLGLYTVSGEVNRLLKCKTEEEEKAILAKTVILKDIPFPKLYEYFGNLEDIRQTKIYVRSFWSFLDELVRSSRLVMDRFVEEGTWGEDWESLFCKMTNELASSVLYDPERIDYSVMPGSQEMFMKDIAASANARIAYMIEMSHYGPQPSDSEDDL